MHSKFAHTNKTADFFQLNRTTLPLWHRNCPHKVLYQDKVSYFTLFFKYNRIEWYTLPCPESWVLILLFRLEVWPKTKSDGPTKLPRTPMKTTRQRPKKRKRLDPFLDIYSANTVKSPNFISNGFTSMISAETSIGNSTRLSWICMFSYKRISNLHSRVTKVTEIYLNFIVPTTPNCGG